MMAYFLRCRSPASQKIADKKGGVDRGGRKGSDREIVAAAKAARVRKKSWGEGEESVLTGRRSR